MERQKVLFAIKKWQSYDVSDIEDFPLMNLAHHTKLFWIRSIHSIIIVLMAACIFYVLYCGICGVRGPLLTVAMAAVVLEGVILLLSGRRCPLTKLAQKYGDKHERFYDSFLPKQLTPYVVPGLTVVFVLGLVLVLL